MAGGVVAGWLIRTYERFFPQAFWLVLFLGVVGLVLGVVDGDAVRVVGASLGVLVGGIGLVFARGGGRRSSTHPQA